MLASYSYGDGIGNHATALYNALRERGVETAVYSNFVDEPLKHIGQHTSQYHCRPDDVILHHLGGGGDMNELVAGYDCRVILNYHNITPPRYFEGYNALAQKDASRGYEDVRVLAEKVDCAISVSEYNTSELRRMGYTCPLHTIPIIMGFDDYKKPADPKILNKYSKSRGITNIVFVGRIAPNKKHEDLILDFYYYTKYYNPNSRLILAGNYRGLENYCVKLKKYAKKLGLRNVIFTGHVQFSELLAYYQVADVFLCESEHEGFCIPLVEAMYFQTPIVAFDSSAVGQTLGTGGILLQKKDPLLAAAVVDQLVRDADLRKRVQDRQREQIQKFAPEAAVDAYLKVLLGE